MRAWLSNTCLLLAIALPSLCFADQETEQRIAWIQQKLSHASPYATQWQYGWTAFYAVATTAYAAETRSLDGTEEQHDRVDARVNAVSSALGLAGMFLDPITTPRNAEKLGSIASDSSLAQSDKLEQAEAMLKQNAAQEANAHSIQTHVLIALVSLVSGVAVARDDHRNDDGTRMALQSLLVGEVQLFTAPTDATEAWQAYQQNGWHADAGSVRTPNKMSGWQLSALPQTISLAYRF